MNLKKEINLEREFYIMYGCSTYSMYLQKLNEGLGFHDSFIVVQEAMNETWNKCKKLYK